MAQFSKSYMPWHGTESFMLFGRRFTSPAAKMKNILDEWRVAEVRHDEAKILYEQTESTDRTFMEALRGETVSRRRQVAEVVERMKSMESFTIYNDKQLWLVFRFFFEYERRAHVDIATELDEDDTETLQFLSGEFFGTEMPYDPDTDFDNACVCFVDVPLVNWAYYDREDDY